MRLFEGPRLCVSGSSLLVAALVMMLLIPAARGGTQPNTNLLANGDAEGQLPAANDLTTIVAPADWISPGKVTVFQYDSLAGFPNFVDPGPADRGKRFFAGGPDNAASRILQTLDLADLAADIDAGSRAFELKGFLGGFASEGDFAQFIAAFRDNTDTTIDSSVIGPVTHLDRGDITGLFERTNTGIVPVGTRSVSFTLLFSSVAGVYNHGFADNLSFKLTQGDEPPPAVPLPPAVWTGSAMLGLAGMWRARGRLGGMLLAFAGR